MARKKGKSNVVIGDWQINGEDCSGSMGPEGSMGHAQIEIIEINYFNNTSMIPSQIIYGKIVKKKLTTFSLNPIYSPKI